MIESAPGLHIDSDTGIDVSLPVAGPGARAYAFLVDWHVRLILAFAWYAIAAVIFNGGFKLRPPLTNDAHWFGFVLAPALSIYVLYHCVLEPVLRGRTPGKRMAGVRIVARDGGVPSTGALLTRNIFRLLDSLPLFYGVGLAATMLTREHLRIGDMAAGTVLVYEAAAARLPPTLAAGGALPRIDAAGVEIITELLERWPTLSVASRAQLARAALARFGATAASAASGDTDDGWRAQLETLLRGAGGA
ncbi:MAG: RDD family protein [Steroidobacterales bacterium]|jgi:uncharacterized RDD family membrane protein YckC